LKRERIWSKVACQNRPTRLNNGTAFELSRRMSVGEFRPEGRGSMDKAFAPLAATRGAFGVFVGAGVIVYPPIRLLPSQRIEYPHQISLTGPGAAIPAAEPAYWPTTETDPLAEPPGHPDQ
jgi:hypothetical protein